MNRHDTISLLHSVVQNYSSKICIFLPTKVQMQWMMIIRFSWRKNSTGVLRMSSVVSHLCFPYPNLPPLYPQLVPACCHAFLLRGVMSE